MCVFMVAKPRVCQPLRMLYFSACPRCSDGTIRRIPDVDGYAFTCLHCGWSIEVSNQGREQRMLAAVRLERALTATGDGQAA